MSETDDLVAQLRSELLAKLAARGLSPARIEAFERCLEDATAGCLDPTQAPFGKAMLCINCGMRFIDPPNRTVGASRHAGELSCPNCRMSHYEEVPQEDNPRDRVNPLDLGKVALTLTWQEAAKLSQVEHSRLYKTRRMHPTEVSYPNKRRSGTAVLDE